LLELILLQEGSVSHLVNQWLTIITKQNISDPKLIESMFHILTSANSRQNDLVSTETIDLLRELSYQLLDEKSGKQMNEMFFKCLVQSTDFWINQSIIGD